MKLYALDTIHISSVGPNALKAGDPFEVSDDDGARLVSRGLASKTAPAAKAARPASNKMAPAVKNKSS